MRDPMRPQKTGVLPLLQGVMEAIEVVDVFSTSRSYPVSMGCFRKQQREAALPEASSTATALSEATNT
jgi:hypothetical protein